MAAASAPKITPLVAKMNTLVREEHQRLVKQHRNTQNSYQALTDSTKNVRLTREQIRSRIAELPHCIQALEDLRELWRALVIYASNYFFISKFCSLANQC